MNLYNFFVVEASQAQTSYFCVVRTPIGEDAFSRQSRYFDGRARWLRDDAKGAKRYTSYGAARRVMIQQAVTDRGAK